MLVRINLSSEIPRAPDCRGEARNGDVDLSAGDRLRDGALEIVTGQTERGVYMQGTQLAQALGLVSGAVLSSKPVVAIKRRTRVLILGVNGFIGNHLTERLLADDNYEIYGLDIGSDAIGRFWATRASTSLKAISAFTRVDRIPH